MRPCVWSASVDGVIRAWDVTGARPCIRIAKAPPSTTAVLLSVGSESTRLLLLYSALVLVACCTIASCIFVCVNTHQFGTVAVRTVPSFGGTLRRCPQALPFKHTNGPSTSRLVCTFNTFALHSSRDAVHLITRVVYYAPLVIANSSL